MSEFTHADSQSISFSEFKKSPDLREGTVVSGVKPQDLFTTQDWIETKKVQAALNREPDSADSFPTKGYVHMHRGRNILVLGDGNTKAIVAWVNGDRVEFLIQGKLPEGTRFFPLSRLRNQYLICLESLNTGRDLINFLSRQIKNCFRSARYCFSM